MVLCASISFVIFGLILIGYGPRIYEYILKNMFVLQTENLSYETWQKNPQPLTLNYYLYNWTNSEDIRNLSIKPKFQEVCIFLLCGYFIYLHMYNLILNTCK